MGTLLSLTKKLGKDHILAAALWKTGWYEARLLAALIGDPV
jgi:3-methyladenine DNA glycosylase AlkD